MSFELLKRFRVTHETLILPLQGAGADSEVVIPDWPKRKLSVNTRYGRKQKAKNGSIPEEQQADALRHGTL